jgi:hypothetical protein
LRLREAQRQRRSHRLRCHYPPHSLPALSRPVNLLRSSRTAQRDIRENRRDASTPKATAQDVETVIPTVLERGGEYFRELWKSLTDSDRNLLRHLVQGETPAAQDKAVLRKLERKEILEKTASSYRFQVPLVQKYIEQVVEEEM